VTKTPNEPGNTAPPESGMWILFKVIAVLIALPMAIIFGIRFLIR